MDSNTFKRYCDEWAETVVREFAAFEPLFYYAESDWADSVRQDRERAEVVLRTLDGREAFINRWGRLQILPTFVPSGSMDLTMIVNPSYGAPGNRLSISMDGIDMETKWVPEVNRVQDQNYGHSELEQLLPFIAAAMRLPEWQAAILRHIDPPEEAALEGPLPPVGRIELKSDCDHELDAFKEEWGRVIGAAFKERGGTDAR